jgi:hypothetical protein
MSNEQSDQRSHEVDWFYLENSETRGPIPRAELLRLFQSGKLGPDTLVWRQGMRDWQPARALGVNAARQPLVPPPATSVPSISPSGLQPPASGLSSRRSMRRMQFAVGGVFAGVAILLCGVWIGFVLRSLKDRTRDESRAMVRTGERTPTDRPSSSVNATASDEAAADPAREDAAKSAMPATETRGSKPLDVGSEPTGMAGAVEQDGKEVPTDPGRAAESSTTPAQTPTDATTLYQVIDIYRRPSYGVQGIMMTQELRYQILTRLVIAPRQADRTCKVTQTIEQVRLDRADEMSRAAYQTALKELVGQQYSFTLNERDEITEFTGFKQNPTNVPVSQPGEAGFLLVNVIDQDGWKELTQRSFLRPRQNVATGQTWTSPVMHDWNPLGSWRGITTYTPRGPEGYGIRYDYTHEMSYVPPEPTAGVLPFQIAGAEFQPVQASGSFVFDAQNGHVIQVREIFHVRGTVATGLMGTTTRLQIEEYQEFNVEISSQNPWQQTR